MGGRGGKSGFTAYSGNYRGQFKPYVDDATALQMLKDETGFSDSVATDTYEMMKEYFEGLYDEWDEEEISIIDNALSHMKPYDGTIYRVIRQSPFGASRSGRGLESGDLVQVAQFRDWISSWTSERSVAETLWDEETLYSGNKPVIFECKNNKSAVGVQHLSPWGKDLFGKEEAEVLAPSTARYKIISISESEKYTLMQVEEV